MAWKKGTMKFTINHDYDKGHHTYVSKEGECPSDFIARILKTSKLMNGEQVYAYLKKEMEEK